MIDLNVGRVFKNRYKIERKISVGQYSVVYLAQDLLLKRRVILKIFPHQNAKRINFKHLNLTFQNELKITAQLKHRNIVQLYDYFVDLGLFVIVLEFIDGISLRTLLNKKQGLDVKTVVSIFLQIILALKYANLNKIIHRDLKPSNILIVDNKTVKILDFGIALDNYQKPRQLFTNKLTGTLCYLSPEAIQQRDQISIQSDIYAVGIMLFEALTGHLPFFDSQPLEILEKHLYMPFPRITDFDSQINLQLENIIIRATAKNRQERYQKPEEMYDDLQQYINNPTKKVQPHYLKSNFYKGKINFPMLRKKYEKKKTHYFWLTNWYLFFFVFINLLLFILLLIFLLYERIS